MCYSSHPTIFHLFLYASCLRSSPTVIHWEDLFLIQGKIVTQDWCKVPKIPKEGKKSWLGTPSRGNFLRGWSWILKDKCSWQLDIGKQSSGQTIVDKNWEVMVSIRDNLVQTSKDFVRNLYYSCSGKCVVLHRMLLQDQGTKPSSCQDYWLLMAHFPGTALHWRKLASSKLYLFFCVHPYPMTG